MARTVLEQALFDVRMERKRRIAEVAAVDFYVFFKEFAWPVLEPGTVYVDNWHIEALCRHLEAVTHGEINRLLVNIPYRQLKSRIISQAWPVWEWINVPSIQFLTASYARDLAIRDAVDSRRIIESAEFQECFGDRFQMTSDQNVKSRYENDKRGMRTITATDAAATGFGGNRIIVDDPISALDADNEIARLRAIEWWRGTVATRFNNPREDAAVIVQQRLNELDLSGYLLSNHPGEWEHLVFPMRYEETRPVYIGGILKEVPTKEISTSLGYVDPRTEVGELLNPKRLDDATVAQMEKDLGAYHAAAQLQQRPTARGGVIFKRADWKFYKELPSYFDEIVLSLDCAFKDTKTSDYVALQAWGRKGAEFYLLKRVRERLGFGATVTATATHKALFPDAVAVLIEDKANGSAVIETISKDINGVLAIEPEGGKVARAYAVQPTHEAGNIYLPDPSIDPEIETFLSEVSSFPNAPNDDETDAFTQAINWFKNRVTGTGILDYYKQQLAERHRREQQGNR